MRRLVILLFLVLALLRVSPFVLPTAAQQSDELVVTITSPVPGQQLFGQVQIVGSAAHPSLFASYTLEYDDLSDPASQWFLAQERVSQQVNDGVLGIWNTTLIPDGSYQLRLRVFLTDGQVVDYTVTNLRVVNTEPTPIPTFAAAPDSAEPSGPTPEMPVIEQPPSNNPDPLRPETGDSQVVEPEVLAPSVDPVEPSDDGSGTRVNFARVRSAFCSGVYLALIIFALMFVYSLVRGPLRPYTRRFNWQPQDDFDENP